MEQQIEKLLRRIKPLAPRASFLTHSKDEILAQPQFARGFRFGLLENAKLGVSLVLGTLLLFVGFGISSYFKGNSSPLIGSFNNKTLLVEANSLNFQIQVREADYFSESAKTVAVALDEITNENGETAHE